MKIRECWIWVNIAGCVFLIVGSYLILYQSPVELQIKSIVLLFCVAAGWVLQENVRKLKVKK